MSDPRSKAELLTAARDGNKDAQYKLGDLYEEKRDHVNALYWYEKAARQGVVLAQWGAGSLLSGNKKADNGRSFVDELQANSYYLALLDSKTQRSIFEKRRQHATGQRYVGIKPNYAAAVTWFKKAADQGFAPAKFSLGSLYYEGRGVKKDHKVSLNWFLDAANQDHAKSIYMVGLHFLQGAGIKQSVTMAVDYFKKAAELGNETAEQMLGNLYAGRGSFLTKDYVAAMTWLHRAVKHSANGAYDDLVDIRKEIAAEAGFSIAENIICTPAANNVLKTSMSLDRFYKDGHSHGNWGQVTLEQELANMRALKTGGTVVSHFWVQRDHVIVVETDGPRRTTRIAFKRELEPKI